MSYIYLVVEDDLYLSILNKVLDEVRPEFQYRTPIGSRGFGYIKNNLPNYNQAAQVTPFLILTDLDRWECPLSLINDWITFDKHPRLLFRIAVKEAEAWLLADRTNLAKFLSVSTSVISRNQESIPDPKQAIINLAKRSRKTEINEDLVPRGTASIGPAYNLGSVEI